MTSTQLTVDAEHVLLRTAMGQYGYLSTWQAQRAGLDPAQLLGLLAVGRFRLIARHLYRLASWPAEPVDEFDRLTRWCVQLDGVISHQSAADTYPELAGPGGEPGRESGFVHVTSPLERVRIPSPEIALHHGVVGAWEIDHHLVFPRTSLTRTWADVRH